MYLTFFQLIFFLLSDSKIETAQVVPVTLFPCSSPSTRVPLTLIANSQPQAHPAALLITPISPLGSLAIRVSGTRVLGELQGKVYSQLSAMYVYVDQI
jgi:hypothetical protein